MFSGLAPARRAVTSSTSDETSRPAPSSRSTAQTLTFGFAFAE